MGFNGGVVIFIFLEEGGKCIFIEGIVLVKVLRWEVFDCFCYGGGYY